MDYRKYQNARNAAWEMLIDLKINELPVKISDVIHKLGITLLSYQKNKRLIDGFLAVQEAKSDGFTLRKDQAYYIFYNDSKMPERLRFTLAHELGHIICGHLGKTSSHEIAITKRNTESSEKDSPIEQEANVFASRLLAPACVLHELKLFTSEQIAAYCKISKTSAVFRLKRLLELEERNKQFLKTKGHGCFYQHPLERQVVRQFAEYIQKGL